MSKRGFRSTRRGLLSHLIPIGLILGLAGSFSTTAAAAQAAPVNANSSTTDRQKQALIDTQDVFESIAQQLDPAVVHVDADIPASSDGAGGGLAPEQGFPFGPGIPGIPGFPGMPQPRTGPAHAAGSGIIVDPAGVIITNRHVVEGADRVTVTLTDHRTLRGTVYSDPNVDLAVIKVNATGLPYAKLADSSKLRVGQWAMAIGYPFDVGETVSVGIVSALGRSQTIENQFYPNLIQTDASINPGNSGGALVDINGNVIGVNTAIAGEAAQSAGIGFAIPASAVSLVWPQLANGSHKITNYPPGWIRGRLGVEVEPVNPDYVKMLGVSQGALVRVVQPDSPAAKAGIEPGDVITEVNGQPVLDATELVDAISALGPDKRAELTVVRNKQPMKITMTTGTFAETPTPTAGPGGRRLGLAVEALTPEIRQELKLPDTVRDGVVVTNVQTGTPADAAGFQQGDVIIRVNDATIHTLEDYTAAMAKTRPGDSVGFRVFRGNQTQFVVLQIPDAPAVPGAPAPGTH